MRLRKALNIKPGDVVSFVGAGGKTTAIYKLAGELCQIGHSVITTTTTQIWPPTPDQSPCLIVEADPQALLTKAETALRQHGHVTIGRKINSEGKLEGLSADVLRDLYPVADVLLVEADGARGRSVKAPAAHEPVIPPSTTILVPVVAIDAVGKPLDEESAHRPKRISAITDLEIGEPITPQAIIALLTSNAGALKNAPAKARIIPLINKVATQRELDTARQIAFGCLRCARIEGMLLGSVAESEPIVENWRRVAAIVLAAGASLRLGQPKQLLPVGENTLLERVCREVCESWVSHVIIVLGYHAAEIRPYLETIRQTQWPTVEIVENPHWANGLSTSVHAGLKAVEKSISAALFVPADQPWLSSTLINRILIRYARTEAPIVLPVYEKHRGNPVLFDHTLFGELLEVSGDEGGRSLIRRHRAKIEEVKIESELPLLDIDAPEDLYLLELPH